MSLKVAGGGVDKTAPTLGTSVSCTRATVALFITGAADEFGYQCPKPAAGGTGYPNGLFPPAITGL